MVDCTGLENQRGGNLSVSSNLTPSATHYFQAIFCIGYLEIQCFVIQVGNDICFFIRKIAPTVFSKLDVDYEKLFPAVP